jgi:hypothetical protein
LAALAREKTSSAIASFGSDQQLRTRLSANNLARQSTYEPYEQAARRPSANQDREESSESRPELNRGFSGVSSASDSTRSPESQRLSQALLDTNPPSRSYESSDSNTPTPTTVAPSGAYNKMHQTSSRLLRMTDDERPFTRVCNPLHLIPVRELFTTDIPQGFQRFVCYTSCQLAIGSSSSTVNTD